MMTSLSEDHEELIKFLTDKRKAVLETILLDADLSRYHVVSIHSSELLDVSLKLFTETVSDADKWLPILDKDVLKALDVIYDESSDKSRLLKKEKVHLRISALPAIPWFQRKSMPRCEDVGDLVQLVGTVTKSVQPKLLTWRHDVKCSACGYTFPVQADFEQYYQLPSSGIVCLNPEGCHGTNLTPTAKGKTDRVNCKDYQEVKVQEQMAHLALGAIPRSIWVTLEDDLVDSVKPGDDVEIIGIVKRRWKGFGKNSCDERTDISLCIKAVNILTSNCENSNLLVAEKVDKEFKQFWSLAANRDVLGRNKLLSYFCPQVYGLYIVKLALCCVLAGGVEKVDGAGTRVRGEPHLLLVGDPGTGKSQLMKYAAKMRTRSVMTTGVGSTSAGLTVSASSEGGQWHLEAGALVLADGGLCCIDEFGCIRESDRACIHEAMEQQTLSVAKAGMVSKLHTRCSVLAATNPKGQYDPSLSLSVNTAIASPLLSRFDLVLTLIDSRNGEWDKVVSDHILNMRQDSGGEKTEGWSIGKLQAYFTHIRRLHPMLSPEANKILSKYYQRQRQTDGADMARTTVRLLQSCVRLAQGHARLMNRSEVTIQDAVMAVLLLESSTESSSSLIKGRNILHSGFPAHPIEEYQGQARMILTGLGLTDIWQVEYNRIQGLARPSSNGNIDRDETSCISDQQSSDQTDFTQVLRIIQKNKAPVIPAPQLKRKRKSKASNRGPFLKKKVEDIEIEVQDEDSNPDTDHENVEDPVVKDNLSSTMMETSPSMSRQKHKEESIDVSPIANVTKPRVSKKTMSKLSLFKRLDTNPSDVVIKENVIKKTDEKDRLKSSILAAAKLVHSNTNTKVQSSDKMQSTPWRTNEEDLDFDLDL